MNENRPEWLNFIIPWKLKMPREDFRVKTSKKKRAGGQQ